jgi:hypothetical protein
MESHHLRWQRQLEIAAAERDIIDIVRRYLASLPEAEVLALPPDCRPVLPSTPEEIATWAVHLVTAEMKRTGGDPGDLLHQLAVVFSGANTRFAQLAQEARMLRPRPPQ